MNERHLLVMVHGVGPEDLTPETAPGLSAVLTRHCALPLHRETVLPPGRELLRSGLAAGLRELGSTVEQRSLVLRPLWRGDAIAIEQCGRRPTGPADVTLLELREPLAAVAQHGRGSNAYLDAIERLDTHVVRAMQHLRRGDTPRLWVLCLGPAQPVERTVDLEASLRRRLPRPLRREVRIQVEPGGAVLRCRTTALARRIRSVLEEPPLSECGELRTHDGWRGGAEALWFSARRRIAFGRQPLRARLEWWPGGRPAGEAFLPRAPRTIHSVTLEDVAVRLLIAAAARTQREELPAARPSATAAPDLLSLMRGEELVTGGD